MTERAARQSPAISAKKLVNDLLFAIKPRFVSLRKAANKAAPRGGKIARDNRDSVFGKGHSSTPVGLDTPTVANEGGAASSALKRRFELMNGHWVRMT